MHEMIPRSTTAGNQAAWEASFQEGVSILLCQLCHNNASMNERKLWLILIDKYGYEFVRKAYERVQAALPFKLHDLPGEEDAGKSRIKNDPEDNGSSPEGLLQYRDDD